MNYVRSFAFLALLGMGCTGFDLQPLDVSDADAADAAGALGQDTGLPDADATEASRRDSGPADNANPSTSAPDFTTSTKTFADTIARAGGAILPGDVLTYTIVVPNTGTVDSKNTVLTDVLPDGVTYVLESITVDGASRSDATGDDQAQFDANTVTVWLGSGAGPNQGGGLAVDATTTVTFQVTVNANAKGNTISNQATISANGATDPDGTPATETKTSSNPANLGSSTNTIVDECSDNSQCSVPTGATPICQTTTHPYTCAWVQVQVL